VTEAVIVSTARTGLGKSWKGAFNMTYGATLGAHAVEHAVLRAGIDPAEVEDVIMGSTFGEGTTGGNIARAIALRAGLPTSTAGMSINRFCSSGLQSIALAADRIRSGSAEILIAGGSESMSLIPMGGNKFAPNPWFVDNRPEVYINMGLTAENVQRKYKIARDDQDAFSFRTQQRWAKAHAAGFDTVANEVPIGEALYSGITTMLGGGTGPAAGAIAAMQRKSAEKDRIKVQSPRYLQAWDAQFDFIARRQI